MGAFNSASSLGRIVGPALAGPIYFSFGHSAPFLAAAVLTAIGAFLLIQVNAQSATPPASGPAAR